MIRAVSIVKNADNTYDITFGNNFFDNVVFEITTAAKNYYMTIARVAIRPGDNFGPGVTDLKAYADLYYKDTESYTDYEVYATLYYSDGSTAMKKLTAVKDDMSGEYEVPGGQGLKCTRFEVDVTKDVVGVAFNSVMAGALSGNTYGGTYFGSDTGTYYDIESRRVVW